MTPKPPRPSEDSHVELSRMSLADHIAELRIRLIKALLGLAVGAVICLVFGRHVLSFLQAPVIAALQRYEYPPNLNTFNPIEYFSVYVHVGLICGLMVASPWVFYQIWAFIAAGLYKRERRMVLLFGPCSLLLFLAGVACMYFVVLPLALGFFLRFSQGMAEPLYNWAGYITMVLNFALAFGIGFQTPLVVIFLVISGLVPLAQLRKVRRYVIVVALAAAAILTPPDWQSQILLAVPMLGLYELGLTAAWLIIRKKDIQDEDSE